MFEAVNSVRHGDTRPLDLGAEFAHCAAHEFGLFDGLPDPRRSMKKHGARDVQKEEPARDLRQCRRLAPAPTMHGADTRESPVIMMRAIAPRERTSMPASISSRARTPHFSHQPASKGSQN